jgi:CubicO group peptidase (beta-lactamase class C family)
MAALLVAMVGRRSEAATKPALPHPFAEIVASTTPSLLKEFAVSGAAVALIRNGEVTWMQGFGVADDESGRPVTPETVFNVGSISKTVTAWGVLRLVDRGAVDLDRPALTYLKRWRLPASSFDAQGVTVRRLLSHTSGVSAHDYHGSDPDGPLPAIEDSLLGKTGTGEVRLVAAPGTGFSYSGGNYAILQLLIEELSGQTFSDYMDATVLQPLGMKASGFGWPVRLRADAARAHGLFGEVLPTLRYNELAVAGLATTLRDLARFASAALKTDAAGLPGRGVLKPETVALMLSPAPATRSANDIYGPEPAYGLGYTVRPQQFAGKVGVGHGGSNRGWESLFQIVPSTGDGIVVLTNGSNGQAVVSSLLCAWRRWATGPGAAAVACPRIDVRAALSRVWQATGTTAAIARYRELRRLEPDTYDFAPRQLNSLAYEVLRRGDVKGAVDLFRLNAEQFPQDWNVHDSLGEAYLKQGDKTRAIESYQKSLELNPRNDNGREVLKSLGVAPSF